METNVVLELRSLVSLVASLGASKTSRQQWRKAVATEGACGPGTTGLLVFYSEVFLAEYGLQKVEASGALAEVRVRVTNGVMCLFVMMTGRQRLKSILSMMMLSIT